jgi:hypothetical protein
MRLRTGAAWILVIAVGLVLAQTALAAIPGTDGVITACYNAARNGQLRVIDVEGGEACRSTETQLEWNQQGPAGSPGAPGTMLDVEIATDNAEASFNSTSWTDLAGASVVVVVPEGSTGTVLARFSPVLTCQAFGSADGECRVRIVVDGAEADPVLDSGAVAVHFENWPGDYHYHAVTIERSAQGLGPGAHVVQVQYQNNASGGFIVRGWHLVAEAIAEA